MLEVVVVVVELTGVEPLAADALLPEAPEPVAPELEEPEWWDEPEVGQFELQFPSGSQYCWSPAEEPPHEAATAAPGPISGAARQRASIRGRR